MVPAHSSTSIPIYIFIHVSASSLTLAEVHTVLDFFPKLQNVRRDFTLKPQLPWQTQSNYGKFKLLRNVISEECLQLRSLNNFFQS